MPRRKAPGAAASIQEQLTEAADTFARNILRVLRATTLSDLTMLAGKAGPVPSAPAARMAPASAEGPRRKRPSPRTSTLRRIAGTKPVICPVVSCTNMGVRSKMNFCSEHASSLSKTERLKLRQQQKNRHISESIAIPEAQKAPPKGAKRGRKKSN